MTQILAMAKRLEEAEKTIEELQNRAAATKSPLVVSHNTVSGPFESPTEGPVVNTPSNATTAAPIWAAEETPLEQIEPEPASASPSPEAMSTSTCPSKVRSAQPCPCIH